MQIDSEKMWAVRKAQDIKGRTSTKSGSSEQEKQGPGVVKRGTGVSGWQRWFQGKTTKEQRSASDSEYESVFCNLADSRWSFGEGLLYPSIVDKKSNLDSLKRM